MSSEVSKGNPGKSETHRAGGFSQGDKHHRFLQERADLAQGTGSQISLLTAPSPFLRTVFLTLCFRQCLIGMSAFADLFRRCLTHFTTSDLSLSLFSIVRASAMGTGQELGHSTAADRVRC